MHYTPNPNPSDYQENVTLSSSEKNWSNKTLLTLLLNKGQLSKQGNLLADNLLVHFKGNLQQISQQANLLSLQQIEGIGPKRALMITAALELSRRIQIAKLSKSTIIKSSKDAATNFSSVLKHLNHEEFWILILNRSNGIIQMEQVSVGGISGTMVDVKKIFQQVLGYKRATAIILAHNHPSGNLMPSQSDKSITKKIQAAGQLLEINVLDHLIITDNDYLSFADEGYL